MRCLHLGLSYSHVCIGKLVSGKDFCGKLGQSFSSVYTSVSLTRHACIQRAITLPAFGDETIYAHCEGLRAETVSKTTNNANLLILRLEIFPKFPGDLLLFYNQ